MLICLFSHIFEDAVSFALYPIWTVGSNFKEPLILVVLRPSQLHINVIYLTIPLSSFFKWETRRRKHIFYINQTFLFLSWMSYPLRAQLSSPLLKFIIFCVQIVHHVVVIGLYQIFVTHIFHNYLQPTKKKKKKLTCQNDIRQTHFK